MTTVEPPRRISASVSIAISHDLMRERLGLIQIGSCCPGLIAITGVVPGWAAEHEDLFHVGQFAPTRSQEEGA